MGVKINNINYTDKGIELIIRKDLMIRIYKTEISLEQMNTSIVSFKFDSIKIPYRNLSIELDEYIKVLDDISDAFQYITPYTNFSELDINLFDLAFIKLHKGINENRDQVKLELISYSDDHVIFEECIDCDNVSDKFKLIDKVITDPIFYD